VYISWPSVSVPVPRLQLVAFTRVTLLVKERQRLRFDITPQQLMVWLDDQGFTLLPGNNTLLADCKCCI
jgi:beta-glucosidase